MEIRDLEHRGDDITHDVYGILNRSLGLPFDRQDAFGLAGALDDIVDLIEEVADLIGLYAVEAPMDQARELATIIREATRAVAKATALVGQQQDIRSQLDTIRDLEHDGDRVARAAVAALFDVGIDPMVVIRWKDLFDRLEAAVDACKTAGFRLETIVAKHALGDS